MANKDVSKDVLNAVKKKPVKVSARRTFINSLAESSLLPCKVMHN